MRRWIIATAVGSAVLAGVSAGAQQSNDDGDVKVRPRSLIRKLVPAAKIEKAALQQYEQQRAQATGRSALILSPRTPSGELDWMAATKVRP
jgi:hypothetical protein